MKDIISKFHGDVRNVSNQLFFQQQLIYAQMLEGVQHNEMNAKVEIKRIIAEIYTFVLSA